MEHVGHAHHFLSRLDRVSLPHVELALMLYRDPALLRFLFERAHVPEQVERVALSLDDPEDGPFLIVTRDGKFVTCLAQGMKAGDLPTITRGQFDAIVEKVGDLRERTRAAVKLAGGRGVNALLRRIYDAADAMSREEFIAISALQPLYAPTFYHLYLSAACDLEDSREILLPVLRKTDKLKPIYDETLHSYWQTLWAMGNLAILTCMDGAENLPEATAKLIGEGTPLSWGCVRQGIVSIGLRGVWAAARIGKPLLTQYKRRIREIVTRLQHIDATACLLAIGTRHSRLRAEVDKALNYDVPPAIKGKASGNLVVALRQATRYMGDLDRSNPQARFQFHREFGAQLFMAMKDRISSPDFRFERAQDVPDEIALLTAINANWSYLERSPECAHTMVWFMAMVPWVARAAPEDLFFPRDTLKALHVPWKPESTLNVLRAMRDHVGPRRDSVPNGPTRKGPCPCGSGKKYKRCCATDTDTEGQTPD